MDDAATLYGSLPALLNLWAYLGQNRTTAHALPKVSARTAAMTTITAAISTAMEAAVRMGASEFGHSLGQGRKRDFHGGGLQSLSRDRPS